ncbi:MAG: hypothetical protein O7F08_01800 [Deltaproteobacteria bacterium]|nr:hypothetical protein [Deltaproteobacteria bacterium]
MSHSRYTGPAGRTRVERVRVFRSEGEPLEVEVFRVLNVEEHPELREPALNGTLHQLEDGEIVDVPFVYHDPVEQHFVLIVPYAARGRELSERARLIDCLMKEKEGDVPDYLRHFAIVHGRRGLARYVDDSRTMEVDVHELEPIDRPVDDAKHHLYGADYYPRIAALLPTADFWKRSSTELATLVDGDELWLFVQVSPDEPHAFAEATSDLLIQLKVVDQIPIAVLTLTDAAAAASRRAYLNPVRSVDGRILELLRDDFHATVVVYDEAGELLGSFRVEAPRAANARIILDRTHRAARAPAERWAHVVDACRAAPPPSAGSDHPFTLEEAADNAQVALQRLRRLEAWSTPERIDEAITIASVPQPVFELARRRVVADGVRFGLGMSSGLLLQAVQFGLASDVHQLLERMKGRFEEMVADPSPHGLTEEDIRRNRVALERLAERHGTSTGPMVSCNMQVPG